MTETALDEFAGTLRMRAKYYEGTVLEVARSLWPYIPKEWRREILQDPRYIQYCKEQDLQDNLRKNFAPFDKVCMDASQRMRDGLTAIFMTNDTAPSE